ncbi:MAG: acyl-CoA dehydrogenase [Acidobacteriota bacterium]
MNFDLTEEQEMVKKMVHEFATKVVAPRAREIDRTCEFPRDVFRRAAELNLTGVAVPGEYGGGDLDTISYVIAIEEVSRYCGSSGVMLSVQNSLVCDPVMNFGNEEQKQHFLKKLASGEWVGSFALTEPDAGSDAGRIRTRAEKTASGYRLTGNKIWVTNGIAADLFIVFATIDPSRGSKGITTFLVERDRPGMQVGKETERLGICGSGSCEVVLDGCEIPESNRLGKEGEGFKVAMRTLDGGRIGIAAQAVGLARAALEEALLYSQQRKQFDQPICEFQAIQWMLADMATEIDAARLLTYKAAWTKDHQTRYSLEASVAKLVASDTAVRATNKGIQIFGGYGYSKEYPMERFFRDSKVTEIYEGTSEIQKIVIASNILA